MHLILISDHNYIQKNHYRELFKEINKNIDIHFISFDDAKELFNINNPYDIFEILNKKISSSLDIKI